MESSTLDCNLLYPSETLLGHAYFDFIVASDSEKDFILASRFQEELLLNNS